MLKIEQPNVVFIYAFRNFQIPKVLDDLPEKGERFVPYVDFNLVPVTCSSLHQAIFVCICREYGMLDSFGTFKDAFKETFV